VSRTRRLVAVAALIAATAAAVSAWPAPSSRALVDVTVTAAAPLRGTDAAWLGLMIAMNESTLVLLERAGPRVADPALAAVVATLAGTHRGELADMLARAERGRLVLTNEHAGHELPGIVTPADLTRIEALNGAAFDAAVRECLREHLEQGARLAASEQRSGTDEGTKRFAAHIERARRADLTKL
jgi:hypothetical protein